MTNNQLTENSVNQLLNSVRLARDNAERADNRIDHSFYYALTIALEELQERRTAMLQAGNSPVIPEGYVMVPKDVSPEQLRAFQLRTKIGAYVTANWSGAYDSLRELWDVAIAHRQKINTMD